MPRSNDTSIDMEMDFIKTGSGHDSKDTDSSRHNCHSVLRHKAVNCCYGNHYRRLSIISIICGLSCIGCIALKYSVKAKESFRHYPEQSAIFAKKARKFSIISLVVWFLILASIPGLMGLISYLATLKD